MIKKYLNVVLVFWVLILFVNPSYAKIKGIYVAQYNLENTAFLKYLIKNAKEAGIDTFVVDLELPSTRYKENIALLKENNINYVARIIMFPDGGKPEQIKNPEIWQKKYRLVKQAIEWGASQIQLDYIRYSSKNKASEDNSKDVNQIILWFKNKLVGQNIPLQVDVFGITSFGESTHIGQNIKLFSQSVDAVCPMVYPSHYVPFAEHFRKPYETVYHSLTSLKKQFGNPMPIKVIPYIELSNYHYPMNREKTYEYIKAQIRAVNEANVEGWYAWSPHNRYENLFYVLTKNPQSKNPENLFPESHSEDHSVGAERNAEDHSKRRPVYHSGRHYEYHRGHFYVYPGHYYHYQRRPEKTALR